MELYVRVCPNAGEGEWPGRRSSPPDDYPTVLSVLETFMGPSAHRCSSAPPPHAEAGEAGVTAHFETEAQSDEATEAMPCRIQLAKESTCPWKGGKWTADAAQLSAVFSTSPAPPLLHPEASPGHPGHSHLALTISLKLGQLQGDLGILAACRNERKVSPAGVAHKGSDQVFGVEYGAMPQEGTKPVWEGGGGRDQVSKGLSMGALSPLWSRHKVPQAGLSDFGPGPCSRQCCDNHLYHLRTRPCAGEGKTGCAGTQT